MNPLPKTNTRIFLWSGPRNISTTLMYSFAQRKDTKVFDEPLYAHYLSKTEAKEYHPDAELIMSSQECNGQKVVRNMLTENGSEVFFYKNMTHHLLDLNLDFLAQGFNLILTRNPRQMLTSFHQVIKNPNLSDTGYLDHLRLAKHLQENSIPFLILDAKEILLDPEASLNKLCKEAEIPFDSDMLHWKPGNRKEDGVWSEHWYASIHESTGFKPYKPKTEPFPEELTALLKQCEPIYEQLLSMR